MTFNINLARKVAMGVAVAALGLVAFDLAPAAAAPAWARDRGYHGRHDDHDWDRRDHRWHDNDRYGDRYRDSRYYGSRYRRGNPWDIDGDGRRNSRDYDRDGDGVPNSRDRHPDDPWRR